MREYWLDPPEYISPAICPICEEECETYYYDIQNEICGCENCISTKNAYDVAEEQERDDEAAYGDYLYEMRRDMEFERRCGNG